MSRKFSNKILSSNKDRQQKKALERYQNCCKEEENQQYSPARYKNQCYKIYQNMKSKN